MDCPLISGRTGLSRRKLVIERIGLTDRIGCGTVGLATAKVGGEQQTKSIIK